MSNVSNGRFLLVGAFMLGWIFLGYGIMVATMRPYPEDDTIPMLAFLSVLVVIAVCFTWIQKVQREKWGCI